MKKIKMSLMGLAIVAATTSAFITAPPLGCTSLQQYRLVGTTFQPVVGTYGATYYCEISGASTCTYWNNAGTYEQCRTGIFVSLMLKDDK